MEGELATAPAPDEGPDLNRLGLAMQLAWLGEARGTQAPDLFRAWTTDVSLEDARIPALEPRLLITKNELSTLSDVLRVAIQAGETTGDGRTAGEFFDILQGAIARLSVNPDRLVVTEFDTLGEALGEYLADLPYRSRLLTIDRSRWVNGGPLRREVLDGLRAKLELYREYDRNPAIWTKLYEGAPDGEDVFAMPLRDLP